MAPPHGAMSWDRVCSSLQFTASQWMGLTNTQPVELHRPARMCSKKK